MKYFSKLFCLLLIIGCNTKRLPKDSQPIPIEYIIIDDQEIQAFAGPNLIRISSNFYADQTEVTNTAYKEYMHWVKMIYGQNSKKYIETLPNNSVWSFQTHTESMSENYFSAPEFDDYPIVGISLEQAKMYSDWRTERVAEMLLIEQEIINPTLDCNQNTCFTLERFLEGIYPLRKELEPNFKLIYPRYTVPTIIEWEILSGISNVSKYGLDSLDQENQKFLKRGNASFHTLEDLENKVDSKMYTDRYHKSIKSSPIRPAKYGSKNIYGLHHTIGNVAEMVDNLGYAKGGDWKHSLDYALSDKNVKQNIPNCWTGFRNVGRLEVSTMQK